MGWVACRAVLVVGGYSYRLAIIISLLRWKLARIASDIMEFVSLGSNVSHWSQVVRGGW